MEGPQKKSLACFYLWLWLIHRRSVVCFAGHPSPWDPIPINDLNPSLVVLFGPCLGVHRNRTDGARRQTGTRVAGPSPLSAPKAPGRPLPVVLPQLRSSLAGPGLLKGETTDCPDLGLIYHGARRHEWNN